MNEKDEIIIKDIEMWGLPSFITRFFIKKYYNQGCIYMEDTYIGEQPTYCSDKITWLEKLKIETYSQKRADELSWKFFNDKYPQYGHYIQLF